MLEFCEALVCVHGWRREENDFRLGGVPRGGGRGDHVYEGGKVRGEVGEGDVLPCAGERCVIRTKPNGEQSDGGEASAVIALCETLRCKVR